MLIVENDPGKAMGGTAVASGAGGGGSSAVVTGSSVLVEAGGGGGTSLDRLGCNRGNPNGTSGYYNLANGATQSADGDGGT